jgi:hypothetical protein
MITGSYSLIIRCDHPGNHLDKVYLDHPEVFGDGQMNYTGVTREWCLDQAIKDGWFIGADQKCLCPVHYVGNPK